MIQIVYAPPGRPAEAMQVTNKLAKMQGLVGGLLEALPVALPGAPPSYDLIINEEGRLRQLEPNRTVCGYSVLGPLFITKADEQGVWISLSDEEAAAFVALLNSSLCTYIDDGADLGPLFVAEDL